MSNLTCLNTAKTSAAVIAIYAPLITLLIISSSSSLARELRPSDHGLTYQDSSGTQSPAMKSFFVPSSSSLPKASDSNNTAWLHPAPGGDGAGGGVGGGVKRKLLVASLASGIAGVVLLVVSGLLFLVKRKRRLSFDNNGNVNFKKK